MMQQNAELSYCCTGADMLAPPFDFEAIVEAGL